MMFFSGNVTSSPNGSAGGSADFGGAGVAGCPKTGATPAAKAAASAKMVLREHNIPASPPIGSESTAALDYPPMGTSSHGVADAWPHQVSAIDPQPRASLPPYGYCPSQVQP